MSCLESQVLPRCLSAEICPRETPCAQLNDFKGFGLITFEIISVGRPSLSMARSPRWERCLVQPSWVVSCGEIPQQALEAENTLGSCAEENKAAHCALNSSLSQGSLFILSAAQSSFRSRRRRKQMKWYKGWRWCDWKGRLWALPGGFGMTWAGQELSVPALVQFALWSWPSTWRISPVRMDKSRSISDMTQI